MSARRMIIGALSAIAMALLTAAFIDVQGAPSPVGACSDGLGPPSPSDACSEAPAR